MEPFYALIVPQAVPSVPGGGAPGYPTHPWVPPYGPAHPIAPGGPPPRPWGPIGNYPDAGFPGPQPGGPVYPSHPIYYPGAPTHPIAPGGPPLGTWGGSSPGVWPQPYPDQGLPGNQPYPGQGLPGNQPYPDQGLPGNQPYPSLPIYYPGAPTHPIVIPPGDLPEGPIDDDKMVIVVFVPGVGYKMLVVPKPPGYNPPTGPSTEIPTPQQ